MMDQPTHSPRHSNQTPSLVRRDVHHGPLHNTLRNLRACENDLGGPWTPLATSPQHHRQESPWHELSASKSRAPTLAPLISKFEALDAASLEFNVREAQPPHLQHSRISGNRNADITLMKTTRNTLLSIAGQPGLGTKILRGIQGTEVEETVGLFDEIPSGMGRGCYGSKINKDAVLPSRGMKLSGVGKEDTSLLDGLTSGAKDKQKSRVREKIRFFDGSMDACPSHVSELWNWKIADGTMAWQPSSQQYPIVPTGKSHFQPASPYLRDHSTIDPATVHDDIKDEGIYQSPKRTSPSEINEKLMAFKHLSQALHTAHIRRQKRDRSHHHALALTNTKPTAAVGWTSNSFEESKRKMSERIGQIYAARSKELENEQEATAEGIGIRDRQINAAVEPQAGFDLQMVDPLTKDSKRTKTADMGIHHAYTAAVEKRLRRESKIQERIALFSNSVPATRKATLPLVPFVNYHQPQDIHQTQIQFTNTAHPLVHTANLGARASLSHAHPPILILATDITPQVESGTDLPTNPPILKYQRPLHRQSAPRKQSQISDRIKHFEAIMCAKSDKILGVAVYDSAPSPPPSTSKRVKTWPFPEKERIRQHKIIETVPQLISTGRPQNTDGIYETTRAIGNNDGDRETDAKVFCSMRKEKQKLHARQERLTRRSRSRSRSALSNNKTAKKADKQMLTEQEKAAEQSLARVQLILDTASYELSQSHHHVGDGGPVKEIWIHDSDGDGADEREVTVLDAVVAQCELAAPRPLRLAEMARMVRLCKTGHPERTGKTERKKHRKRSASVEMAAVAGGREWR